MIYILLKGVSEAVYSSVLTIWHIEEALIHLMMTCFLLVVRIACQPFALVPLMAMGIYYGHKMWLVRHPTNNGLNFGDAMGRKPGMRPSNIQLVAKGQASAAKAHTDDNAGDPNPM